MQPALPAPDAGSTLLGSSKGHCAARGLEQAGQSPRPTRAGSDLKVSSPSQEARESRQLLLILAALAPPQGTGHWGWGDTQQDAGALSLQLKGSQELGQRPRLTLFKEAVLHRLLGDSDHSKAPREGQRPQPGLAPPRHFPPPSNIPCPPP